MKLEDLDLGDMTPEEVIQSVILYELYTSDEDLWYSNELGYVFRNNLPEKQTWPSFINCIKEIIREQYSRLAETCCK